ncbi:MAG: tRNA (adenosine(37)-N6)-dimethylallyltransferase MiaA [Acidobacteria bacterium]|nr:tRNA (adenosine(37)-N6)-dimethylallyltransferase MiaA [Acidobacteriota bacterium]
MTVPGKSLLVILGPTASGKSALALFLAEKLNGEILACDSTQVYRHFDIGTAKPTAADRARVPHHLLDLCDPQDEFTAGDYLRLGRAALDQICARGRLPIVVAGTGLYLRALLEGLSPLPPRSPELRARLQARAEEKGSAHLHGLLARVDPASAKEVAPQDTPKLVRALEVFFVARRPRAELFREGRPRLEGYAVEKLSLLPDRQQLYQRIEARVDAMLAAGWLDEARRLRERWGDGVKPFGFLGYKQLAAHLRGEVSLAEAVKQIKQETRNFAKRQLTWFRREPGLHWLAGFGDAPALQAEVLARLRATPLFANR